MPEKSIESVLREHTPALMSLPGVVGTAQGECAGQPCIRVFVAKKTLELLGFSGVDTVRSIKTFEITLNGTSEMEARKSIESMCQRLLANPVVHNYSINIRSDQDD